MAAYREQELVLRGREPGAPGLLLAPVQEPAQLCAEFQQPLVVAVGELGRGASWPCEIRS